MWLIAHLLVRFLIAVITRCSGTAPRLSQEIIEYIADYLWDEPVQLTKCSLVCAAWYYAAKRHLSSYVAATSDLGMKRLVHILMSRENRKYREAVKHIKVGGKPSLRTFHMRLPGQLLKSLESLEFAELDWTPAKLRFQPVFYRHLSYFASVKTLYLRHSRFICAEDLAKVICALPNLSDLNVDSITVERATHGCSLKEKIANYYHHRCMSPSLTELCFWGQRDEAHPTSTETEPTGESVALHQDVLDALSACSTSIKALRVSTTQFASFDQFRMFLDNFPQIRSLALERNPQWEMPPPSASARLLVTKLKEDEHVWEELHLLEMQSATARGFIDLFFVQGRKVRELDLELLDWPTPALHRTVGRLTDKCGRLLNAFRLNIQTGRLVGFSKIEASQVSRSHALSLARVLNTPLML